MATASDNSWSDNLVTSIADAVYERVKQHLESDNQLGSDKLSYTEAEAAAMIGVAKHVLKGCRERGEIHPVKVGKAWRYSREQLITFINRS